MSDLLTRDERPLATELHLRDFDASWAGAYTLNQGFCCGSESGELAMLTEAGELTALLSETTPSREAVNGVAFIGQVVGVSTRADVALIHPAVNGQPGIRSVFDFGAHGIIATTSGYFAASLGPSGLMLAKPDSGQNQTVTIRRVAENKLNFYKTASVLAAGHPEVLACALRSAGIGVTVLSPADGKGQINSFSFHSLDVVDVCSLGDWLATPAIGALGKDGTLVLIRDVLSNRAPLTLKFPEINGTAYRLLSGNGHVFMLTSEAVYAFSGLAQRFLDEEHVEQQPASVRKMPVEAVDANLAGDRWMLAVMNDHVLRIEVDLLVGNPSAGDSRNGQQERTPVSLSPNWETRSERHFNVQEMIAV